ncbi:MAG: hypothetical protein JSR98_20065 [Proteobacteria bacterium]|nr:hypothetical protein [Pseudomonadota bacterium]
MIDFDATTLAAAHDAFGEPVVYLPKAGGSYAVTGIFDDGFTALMLHGDDGDPAFALQKPVVSVRDSQLPVASVKGDRITIPRVAKTYRVVDIQPDGKGSRKLELNLSDS